MYPFTLNDNYWNIYISLLPSHKAPAHPVIQPTLHRRKILSNRIVRIESRQCLDNMYPVLALCYASHKPCHRHVIPLQDDLLVA